ncbi:MAG: hypothetical protein ACOCRK_02490 [bacterium]
MEKRAISSYEELIRFCAGPKFLPDKKRMNRGLTAILIYLFHYCKNHATSDMEKKLMNNTGTHKASMYQKIKQAFNPTKNFYTFTEEEIKSIFDDYIIPLVNKRYSYNLYIADKENVAIRLFDYLHNKPPIQGTEDSLPPFWIHEIGMFLYVEKVFNEKQEKIYLVRWANEKWHAAARSIMERH